MSLSIAMLLIAGALSAAGPQPAHAPITVEQCSASYGSGTTSTSTTALNTKGQYERTTSSELGSGPKLTLSFTNDAKQIASDVRFVLVQNDRTVAHIDDAGKFTPNVRINHKFKLPPEVSPLGLSSLRCDVQSVRYQDGTTWAKASP